MKEKLSIFSGQERQVQIQRLDVFTGLSGIDSAEIALLKQRDNLDSHISEYIKRPEVLSGLAPFSLDYCHKPSPGWISQDWGNFYLDNPRAFFLTNKLSPEDDDFALAGISFAIVNLDRIDQVKYPQMNTGYLSKGDILVSQIQVQDDISSRGVAELKKIRWEKKLLGTVVSWADEFLFSRVLVVPAANNYWLNLCPDQTEREKMEQRLFMRYDVTATRLGFRREETDAPYCLETAKQKIFNTVFG